MTRITEADLHPFPPPDDGRPVHELFEEQARRTPSAIAITFEDESVSYGDLDAMSQRVANALVGAGVRPRQAVAVLMSDGPRQIAALLGVLEAGGVIVCLDSESPTERLRRIVDETKPALLLTDGFSIDRHEALIHALSRCAAGVLILDSTNVEVARARFGSCRIHAELDAYPTTKPAVKVASRDPVYIVYTSGSTGEPKGIVQSHGSFSQYVEWQIRQFGVGPPQRFAQWASVAYDAGYRQIFGTLCAGATLCMAPSAVRYNPSALLDWVRDARVTILNVVPSFCWELIRTLEARGERSGDVALPHLEQLLLTGEAVPVALVEAWRGLFRDPPRLTNLYGPSECILATFHPIESVARDQLSVPIGRAIDGREILILDEELRPCPPGERGEIYIRSPYLTMGYFRRPEETARRFLPNPLPDASPDPVYRTGDLGRRREDGVIEFRGRVDNQVKLRGVRIEPGEIEAALQAHEGIRSCAVVVRRQRAGDDREDRQELAAYYTSERPVDVVDLRTSLGERLPASMIPQRFVRLDQLPLNANRKVDRKALAEREDPESASGSESVAPRDPVEQAMAEIWRDVLGVERVGVEDSFFGLGGDSLHAMQVINRTRAALDLDLSYNDLLGDRTLAELARELRER